MPSQRSQMLPRMFLGNTNRRHHYDIARQFEVSDVTSTYDCPILGHEWQQLLASGASHEKIYQARAYFEHIIETHSSNSAFGLIAIYGPNKNIVGILPVREYRHELRFQIGPVCLLKCAIAAVQVLGSVPLLDTEEPQLLEFAFKHLLKRYRGSRALVMQAVPRDVINQYNNLSGLAPHTLHGLRDCHVCVLPNTVELYLQKLSSKKRYNLLRQCRLLSDAIGGINLVRVTTVDQISGFVDDVRSLPVARKHLKPGFENQLSSLARLGLVLCYALKSGNEVVAVIVGKQCDEVWHIHNIYYQEKFSHLSAGTAILHLAQQDVIEHLPIRRVDFGYGTPSQESRSHHLLEKRAHILLCGKNSALNVILKASKLFETLNQRLGKRFKSIKK